MASVFPPIAQFVTLMTLFAALGCSPSDDRPNGDLPAPKRALPPADVASGGNVPRAAVSIPQSVATPSLVVLGIAQDAGVPQAGCDCPRCRAAADEPRTSPRVASVALALPEGRVFIVDATPDLPWQLRDVAALRGDPPGGRTRTPVTGVLLTHGHMGHYLGLAHLGFEAAHADRIPVYGTDSMLGLLRDNAPWSQLVDLEEIEPRPLTPGTPLPLSGVRVVPVAVPHRAERTDTVGYRFEGPHATALYVPDCDPWSRWDPQRLDALLEGVDVALLDGTFYSGDELPGRDLSKIGHPLVVDTMDWIDQLEDPPRVHFIHLNHSNPALLEGEQRREIERRGYSVATRGQTIPL